MLDDELLTRALRESREHLLEQLPEEPLPEHLFSDDFESEMERLLRCTKQAAPKRRFTGVARRAAAIALVALAGLSASVLSVDAWREKLFHMVEDKKPEYSNITYEPVDGNSSALPKCALVEYRPAYLPDGYILTDQMLDTTINWSSYQNADGGLLSFHQSVLGTVGSAINTEGAALEEFELSNGDTAFKMSNMGTQFVLWSDNQYEYMITLNGHTLDEAVKIAESTQLCPKDAPHPPQLKLGLYEVPEEYPPEAAVQNGDVVLTREGTLENGAVLDRFFTDYAAGKQSIVRISDYQQGNPLTCDLYYDSLQVTTTIDETRLTAPGEGTVGRSYEEITRTAQGGTTVVSLFGKDGQKELLRYASPET